MATIIQQTRCSPCAAGLSGFPEDFIKSIGDLTTSAFKQVTGASANELAQANALRAQEIQAGVAIEEAKARSAAVMKVVPWVAGGVVVLIGSVVAIKLLGKK